MEKTDSKKADSKVHAFKPTFEDFKTKFLNFIRNDAKNDIDVKVGTKEADSIALYLRVGLGIVFLVGGCWKLSRALSGVHADALVSKYTATNGYINSFFMDFLFGGSFSILSPHSFLTLLSAFELIAGIALITGLFVRSFSFIFAFLLWTFVVALPVATVPGVVLEQKTHLSPAILVQIRDITLSGLCFILFILGSGSKSLDRHWFQRGFAPKNISWDNLGLLLRLSLAATFIVGGVFFGGGHIKSFIGSPLILTLIGLLMLSGHLARTAGALGFAVISWYCLTKLSFDASLLNNFNAIKRELALLAGAAVLTIYGPGSKFIFMDLFKDLRESFIGRPNAT